MRTKTTGGNQAFLEVPYVSRKPALPSGKKCCALTSIFADARFFLMTLFSEYCSIAMMACVTKKRKNTFAWVARGGYLHAPR